MLSSQIWDIKTRLTDALYVKSFNTEREFQFELYLVRHDLIKYLTRLEQFLEAKQWFLSDRLSYIDFLAYEFIDWYRLFVKQDCLEKYPKLTNFMTRFEQLPRLSEYFGTEEYRKLACTTPFAKLGYTIQ